MTVKIDTKGWQRLRGAIERLQRREARAGIFEGNIAKIGTVHEFGAPGANVPERSFMRSALREGRDEIVKLQARVARLVLTGKLDEVRGLTMLGVWMRDAFKRRIIEQPSEWPPVSPKTQRRKGPRKNKILINTGQLINSIVFKIVGR